MTDPDPRTRSVRALYLIPAAVLWVLRKVIQECRKQVAIAPTFDGVNKEIARLEALDHKDAVDEHDRPDKAGA